MNVAVIVSPLEAPGLDFKRKNDVRAALAYFQGVNQKLSVDPTLSVDAADLYTKAIASAPDSIKTTLMLLRIKFNGKVIDTTKSFNDLKIKVGDFITVDVLVN